MANWQRTLKMQPEWDQANDGEITTAALAKIVSKRLSALDPFDAESWEEVTRLELVEEFEDLADVPELTQEEFNWFWAKLYEWADTPLDDKFGGKKVCWVQIF